MSRLVHFLAISTAIQQALSGWSPPPMQQPSSPKESESAMQAPTSPPIRIISLKSQVNSDGTYAYMYETENGIQMQEQGFTKEGDKVDEKGKKESINVAQGSYSYTSPEGREISVSYMADENGFQTFENEIPRGGGQPKKPMPPMPPAPPRPKPKAPEPSPKSAPLYRPSASYQRDFHRELDEDEEEEEDEEPPRAYSTSIGYRF